MGELTIDYRPDTNGFGSISVSVNSLGYTGATVFAATEEEIAKELCLTQRYVRAIEEDDLKNLPGTFFYKSYVKQYAAFLGVNQTELHEGIEALTAAEDTPAPPVNAPSPLVTATNRRYFSKRSLGRSVAGLVGVVFACSAFYAWWEKPARAVTIQPSVVRQASVRQAVRQTPSIQTAPVEAVTGNPGADAAIGVALNLSATENTWLQITSGGKQIFSGVLEASHTKILTGLEMAQMKVGNAGGIEVQWNGKPIGPIGPRGTVRVVLFTADNFEILPSDPPPPAESL
jgi:cytoskeletal protein RodZ